MHLIQLHGGIHNATVVKRATEYAERASRFVYSPSVRLSPFVRPSVTRVNQSKTVGEDYAISPYSTVHRTVPAA